jgi:hypothetical protein
MESVEVKTMVAATELVMVFLTRSFRSGFSAWGKTVLIKEKKIRTQKNNPERNFII